MSRRQHLTFTVRSNRVSDDSCKTANTFNTSWTGTWVTLSPQVSDDIAEEVITCAYESGINLFDTAEFYSGDQAELRLGRILKKQGWRRTGFIVITKVYWSSR